MRSLPEFIGEPQPFNQVDYVRLREAYTALLSGVPGVRAIYEYGNSNYHPGISDLDLIAVTEERIGRRAASQLMEYPAGDPASQVLRGRAKVVSIRLFKNPLLAPHWEGSLRHRSGELIARPLLPPETERCALLITALDRVPQTMIGLTQRLSSSRWHVIATLGHLRAVTHELLKYEQIVQKPLSGSESYMNAVQDLRRNWFSGNGDRYHRMMELVSEALCLEHRLTARLEHFFIEQGWGAPWDPPEAVLKMDDKWEIAFRHTAELKEDDLLPSAGHPRILLSSLAVRQLLFMKRYVPDILSPSLVQQLPLVGSDSSWEFQGKYRTTLLEYLQLQRERKEFLRLTRLPVVVCEGAWWHRLEVQRPHPFLRARRFIRRIQTKRTKL